MSRKTRASHGGIHSPQMACYHAVHDYPQGLSVIALMMEKNADTLRKKLDINKPSHVLTLDEAMHILRITGDTRILDALNAEAGAVWFYPEALPESPSDMDVLAASTGLMGKTMALIDEFRTALEDGDVTSDERARLDQRRMELFRQIHIHDETVKQFENTEGNA